MAETLERVLESLVHNPTIVTDDGARFADGDTFLLEDGINQPAVFEFESGYVLQMPLGGGNVAAGGIEDGETFTIVDASGLTAATFEFDKDIPASVVAGNTRIPIQESSSALSVAKTTVSVLQASPLRTLLGLTPAAAESATASRSAGPSARR